MLAAGLEADDPAEAYKVDLMTGPRTGAQDREIALSYVRNAERFKQLTPNLLRQHFPDVLSAVDNLREPAPTALRRITYLLKRHGKSVTGVMDRTYADRAPESYPDDSLPRMYGDERRQQLFAGQLPTETVASEARPEKATIVIDEQRQTAVINDVVQVRHGASFGLLLVLAKEHLKAAGKGLDPFQFPTLSAHKLAKELGFESDAGVRQRVGRSRTELGKKYKSAGLDPEVGKEIIENILGQGYRFAPDRVEVRKASST